VEKYCKARQATDDNIIRRKCFVFRINKATASLLEYVIPTAFPRQLWLQERTSISRYNTLPVLLWISFSCLDLSDIYGKNVLSGLSVNTSTKKKTKRSVTRSSNLIAPTVILPIHDRAIADKERSCMAWSTSAIQHENKKEKTLTRSEFHIPFLASIYRSQFA
jgi:hypothetical protein